MKIQSINNNYSTFQGSVKLKANTMSPFDIEYIKKGAPRILDYAKTVAPDFVVFKENHLSMTVKAVKDNKELTSPVFKYNVEDRTNIVEELINTMKYLVESI